jgi:methyl acetate hydrolase
MTKKIGVPVALLMMAGCAASAPRPNIADFDNVLRTAVQQRRVPGVIAMVATADTIAYQGAFGMNKDAIVAIASMTKPVTSVAVMQLVETGKVKLDEPAATYVPELAKVQVVEGGSCARRRVR